MPVSPYLWIPLTQSLSFVSPATLHREHDRTIQVSASHEAVIAPEDSDEGKEVTGAMHYEGAPTPSLGFAIRFATTDGDPLGEADAAYKILDKIVLGLGGGAGHDTKSLRDGLVLKTDTCEIGFAQTLDEITVDLDDGYEDATAFVHTNALHAQRLVAPDAALGLRLARESSARDEAVVRASVYTSLAGASNALEVGLEAARAATGTALEENDRSALLLRTATRIAPLGDALPGLLVGAGLDLHPKTAGGRLFLARTF